MLIEKIKVILVAREWMNNTFLYLIKVFFNEDFAFYFGVF